ncbi:MAG: hypothetical protein HQL69_20725 [Magnetococcales bacterium]|nr:hypothetical protein [Magnetococcales bacterium]
MGIGTAIHCHTCGYTEEFHVRIGHMHTSLEEVMPRMPAKAKRILTEVINNQGCTELEHDNNLFGCQRCNTLHIRFYVRVEYDNGDVVETKHWCSKCKKRLVLSDRPINLYNCKKCGSQTLEMGSHFLGLRYNV